MKQGTMTREEEIQKAAKIFHASSDDYTFYNKGFEAGAKWADQNPKKGLWDSEKVCKWLNDRIGIDQKIEIDSDGKPLADSYIAYCIARQNAADTMIEDLRKAMEE